MASLKSKIKFNKVRNKGDKLKAKLKKDKTKDKKVKDKKPKNKRKIWYWVLIGVTSLAILMFAVIFAFAAYIVMNAPEFSEDKLYNKESTILYKANGEELATLGMNVGSDTVEKRVKLSYDELPQVLIDAIVATEDSRFFQHNGVDLARFIKASIGQVLGQSGAGGASTLTMQVSKIALTDTTSEGIQGIIRKFTDVYLSVFKIEKQYTKQDILEFYANTGFLGNNSFGVEQASLTYFGKSATDLTLAEAAMIAGLFQAPSAYDPYAHPDKAKARRNQVLNLMLRHGYISEEECEIAKSMPITELLVPRSSTATKNQGYIDTVIEEIKNKYKVDPYVVPLKVYTMFDESKQEVIDNIYNGNFGYQFKDEKIQLAIAVVDNKTGALVAVGAGRNKTGELSFNYATMTKRHPGSTIKPILDYGPAFEYLNWSTYTPLFDEEYSYTGGGKISNWNKKYSGLVTTKTALSKSMNTAALQAFQATSNDQKWEFATKLGITPGNDNGIIRESSSIGAFEGTNPVELAGAYAAFATGGYYTEPYTITKIEFIENGNVIENQVSRERVMKETTAFLITNILFNVTPSAANVSGTQVATKTGTSSYDESAIKAAGIRADVIQDSWVATYNPDFTIAFWYGYDELYPDYYNVMSSATTNRNKIQSLLTKNIFNTGSRFSTPKGVSSVQVELETIPAKLPSPFTPSNLIESHYFISGTEPTEVSTRFSQLSDPTKLKVVENGTKATLSWVGISTPDAVDKDYLTNYFTSGYKDWAGKYLEIRNNYNAAYIGNIGYDIYLKSGSNLTYVGFTTDTNYTISNTTNYDSVVVKAAYSIFKSNASNGVEATLTGASTSFSVELVAVSTSTGDFINPTYKVGETIPDMGLKTIKFLINNVDMTDSISSSDKSYIIRDCTESTCKTVTDIDNSKPGKYQIVYTVNYLGTPYKATRNVHVEDN